MPRRKRTGDEGGRRAKVSRVENSEEPLVISDSEHEEEDCSIKRTSRTTRWKRRENESHLRDLTEDQMLALAMRLSAEEASTVAQKQELEDCDIQKAIEESLNESTVIASDGHEDEAGSSDQPQQNVATELQLRRKLCYSSQDQTHSENDRESTSPLPEMPDLSQTTCSQLSSRSSAQISGPPASTQSKNSEKQTDVRDTPELFKSLPESQSSPFFPRHGSFSRQPVVCVEKLSQDLISTSTDSAKIHTPDSTVGSHFPEQEDSLLSKCPVFKQEIHLLEDKDECNVNGTEDETQIPDEDAHLPTQSSQVSNTDPDTCLSPSRSSRPLSPKCVPVNNKENITVRSQKTSDIKQVEAQTTQDRNVKSATETTPNAQSWDEFKSHMVLHLTDDDDDEDDGSEEVLSPSPAPEKSFRPIKPQISPTLSHISSSTITLNPSTQDTQMSRSVLEQDYSASKAPESKASDHKPLCSSEKKAQCHISYYWGVPFCPIGQNPDEYTRVIMCQMEVYGKSLKEAQRELLRKADWGQPVFPGSERPFGARRWKRHRAPQLSEDEENEEEKENNTIEVEVVKEETREECVAESQEDAEAGQSEPYVVLSSPETKDEKADETPFFNQKEPVSAGANKHFRKNIPWDTSDETQTHRPPEQEEEEAQNQEGCEEDEMVCPETQMTENSTPELMLTSPATPASPTQPQSRADSEVMEVEEGGGAAGVTEEEMMEQENDASVAAPSQIERMECPMCSRLFPLSRIEVHAALCDGEADQNEVQSQVVVARPKRNRRNVTEETQWSDKAAPMEKCFLCQGLFSEQEYLEHVNLCYEKRNSKTNQQENGLLSALDRTERRQTGRDEPGPSDGSTERDCSLADPALTGTSESVTSCPSNTFSPQSENTDCLPDSSKISQRLSRKRKFKR